MPDSSYGNLHAGGDGAVNDANSEAFYQGQKRLQSKMRPGYLLDKERDIQNLREGGKGYPLGAQMAGHWVTEDREDDERMAAFLGLPHNDDALGMKVMPTKDLIDYSYKKLKKAQRVQWLQLARQMIDDRDPRTQEEAAAIVPELEKTPREFLKQNVGMQMALWEMLWAGRIRGEQDLDFLFAILRDDVEIPLAPLWDPIGIFAQVLSGGDPTRTLAGTVFGTALPGNKRPSLFSKFLFGIGDADPNNAEFRMNIKIAICKRVLPNLRNREDKYVQDFITDVIFRSNEFFKEKGILTDPLGGGQSLPNAIRATFTPKNAQDKSANSLAPWNL